MRKIILISALILMINLFAVNDNAGTSGFTFLKLNFYARAAAMANAYSAISNDVNSVFYNPAGLAKLENNSISSTYMNYLVGINNGSIVYGFNYKNNMNLAVFSQFLYASEKRTLIDEQGAYHETDETFGMSDILIGIGMGKTINNVLDIGANLKFIRETLDSNSASAVVFDFALIHQTTNENLKVGIVLKNIGKQITYFSDKKYDEKLPKMFIVGFNYKIAPKIHANLDITKPFENDLHAGIGLEYIYNEFLQLRSGYKTNASIWQNGGKTDFLSGLSLGFGLNWNKINFDYAIVSYGDLGIVNQISLGYRF